MKLTMTVQVRGYDERLGLTSIVQREKASIAFAQKGHMTQYRLVN